MKEMLKENGKRETFCSMFLNDCTWILLQELYTGSSFCFQIYSRKDIAIMNREKRDLYKLTADLKEKQFIVFGISSLQEAEFGAHAYNSGIKPAGGLCAYEYMPNAANNYVSEYERNCVEKESGLGDLRNGIIFHVLKDAKILYMNTWADIIEIMRNFPLPKGTEIDGSMCLVDIGIDYRSIQNEFDAVYFSHESLVSTNNGGKREIDAESHHLLTGETRDWQVNGKISIDTSGFDAPCLCIFNKLIITDIKPFQNKTIYEISRNEAYDEIVKELQRGSTKEEAAAILKKYYESSDLAEFIAYVEKTEKDSKKFHELVSHINGLIQAEASVPGLSLSDDIEHFMEKAYHMVYPDEKTDSKSFIGFKNQIQSAFHINTDSDKKQKKTGESESVEAMFEGAFN